MMSEVRTDGVGRVGQIHSHQRKGEMRVFRTDKNEGGQKILKLVLTSFVNGLFLHGRSPPPLLRFGPPLI